MRPRRVPWPRTATRAAPRSGQRQNPWDASSLTGDFYFNHRTATVPPGNAAAPPAADAPPASAPAPAYAPHASAPAPAQPKLSPQPGPPAVPPPLDLRGIWSGTVRCPEYAQGEVKPFTINITNHTA